MHENVLVQVILRSFTAGHFYIVILRLTGYIYIAILRLAGHSILTPDRLGACCFSVRDFSAGGFGAGDVLLWRHDTLTLVVTKP